MGEGEVNSKCGICVGHSLSDVYHMLENDGLQHRGQDAWGIAAKTEHGIDVIRGAGPVRSFSLDALQILLDDGWEFMGEVRYSTNKEKGENLFLGALPRFLGGEITRSYDLTDEHPHMIVRGSSYAIVHNGHLKGVQAKGLDTDTDVMLKFYTLQDLSKGVEGIVRTFPAAFAIGIMDSRKKGVQIAKDRKNIRPLMIGKKDGRLVAASESHAIERIGGIPLQELGPAEILDILDIGTNIDSFKVDIQTDNLPCFFEEVYLGHPLSFFKGVSNTHRRIRIGRQLGRELQKLGLDKDIDIISFVPKAPDRIAVGVKQILGKPLVSIFYKAEDARSFLYGSQIEREHSIGSNLYSRDNVDIKGAGVLLVEDSVVRGTNFPDAVRKAKLMGCKEVYGAIGTPVLGPVVDGVCHGCEGGVDMAPDDNFAIRRYNGDVGAMAEDFGMGWMHFLTKQGMERAYKNPGLRKLCTTCIGGQSPVKPEELEGLDRVVDTVYEKYPVG